MCGLCFGFAWVDVIRVFFVFSWGTSFGFWITGGLVLYDLGYLLVYYFAGFLTLKFYCLIYGFRWNLVFWIWCFLDFGWLFGVLLVSGLAGFEIGCVRVCSGFGFPWNLLATWILSFAVGLV